MCHPNVKEVCHPIHDHDYSPHDHRKVVECYTEEGMHTGKIAESKNAPHDTNIQNFDKENVGIAYVTKNVWATSKMHCPELVGVVD